METQNINLEVLSRYDLKQKIGRGGMGIVYRATNKKGSATVAIKLEHVTLPPHLDHEADIYAILKGGLGISKTSLYSQQDDYNVLVLDHLGPSLDYLLRLCDGSFSLKTILLLADQLICRLRFIHKRHVIHRDIKPANLLLGTGREGNTVHLIDFGLAFAEYDNASNRGKAIGVESVIGTPEFASVGGHLGNATSKFDDLESLAYVLISFQKELPWGHLRTCTSASDYEAILALKKSTLKEICEGLPEEFSTFLAYVRRGQAEEQVDPDYRFLRNLFRRLFRSKGYRYDFAYDWSIRVYENLKSQNIGGISRA